MSQGSEIFYDAEAGESIVVNESNVPTGDIFSALQDQHPEIATLIRWGNGMKSHGRSSTLFERDRFVTPRGIFDQFRTALDAAENDDVVSGILESTEAMAFNKVSMTCDDEQEEDVWNQIIDDMELDRHLREMWRETFTVSQFYAAVIWGNKDYKVQAKTKNGNKSKKTFNGLRVPVGLTILDPMRVVPVGPTLFGQEQLAYIATPGEATNFNDVLAGYNTSDQVVKQIIKAPYEPDRKEKQWIAEVTGAKNLDFLFLMNEQNVFRHSATKPDYMRFANVRMKSVFELLDMKHQLRQMDRAYLIGGTNFIILVKKGSDTFPAKQSEVENLATQIKGTARVPVIIGDHRIDIEIITPSLDNTLKPERYNTLDARITARLYQMFMTGNYAAGASGDDSIKLARVVARGMESRRFMIWKTIEKYIMKPTYEKNAALNDPAMMNFHPKRIALDFDPNVATFMQDLRDRGDISRETLLSELDIDQTEEARRREREADHYDDVFTPTNVPFSGNISVKEQAPPGPTAPGKGTPDDAPKPTTPTTPAKPAPTGNTKGVGRRQGGNTNGGGANKQSGVSQPGRGTKPVNRVNQKPKPA